MYLNNVGFRAIGRIMKIPFQTIHSWIRKAGKTVELIAKYMQGPSRTIEIVEMDELYTYVKKKECQVRVWLAVERNTKEVIGHHVGDGSKDSANKLYEQIKHHKINIIATDGNYSYGVTPEGTKHIISKAETS